MTDISMRIARVLGKRNMTNSKMSIEEIAKVIDEAAYLPFLCSLLSTMDGLEIFDKLTSVTARETGTF